MTPKREDSSSISAALPRLASNLLDLETDQSQRRGQQFFWITGAKAIDDELPYGFWSGGGLIGLSEVREGEDGGQLALQLLANHLLESVSQESQARIPNPTTSTSRNPTTKDEIEVEPLSHPGPSRTGSALPRTATFLITPATNTPFTPQTILSTIQRLSPSISQSSLHDMLSSISLLRYFDFPGIIDSVSEVSSTLRSMSQQPTPSKNISSAAQSSDSRRLPSMTPNSATIPKTLLIIDGIDTTIANVRRKSSILNANGLLASLLRQLRHLTSTNPNVLTLLATTSLVRGSSYSSNPRPDPTVSSFLSSFAASPVIGLTALTISPNRATQPQRQEQPNALQPPPPDLPTPSRSIASTSQILESDVLKWVLVHEATGQRRTRIVEVIKDDTFGSLPSGKAPGVTDDEDPTSNTRKQEGWALGCWAVWK